MAGADRADTSEAGGNGAGSPRRGRGRAAGERATGEGARLERLQKVLAARTFR